MSENSTGHHAQTPNSAGAAATPRQRVLNDRYELGDLIGRGGMADVWRGRDLLLGRDVAVKILRSDLARDPIFQARFRREAKAVAGLNDPAIVAVFDTGDTDIQMPGELNTLKVPFIVMEFVSGHTLKERLQGGPLPAQDAVNATLGVLAALTSSHAQSIVHRDIKPANVMITNAGAVKVMDFGIARALADSAATMTQTQAVVGTAQYLSPEQARGESVDERSDIYSAGCLLFELLTGRPPFIGDSPVSVAYQHVGEQPPLASQFNPSVTPQLDAVLAMALTKDRTKRIQTAGEFASLLRAAQRGEMPMQATQATSVITPAQEQTQAMASLAPAALAASAAAAAPATGGFGTIPEDASHEDDFFSSDVDQAQEVRDAKKRRTITWIVSLVLLALVVAGAVLVFNWAQAEAERTARVPVPQVVGKTLPEAQTAFQEAQLSVIKVEEVFNDEVAKGLVIDTTPGAGTEVLKTSEVLVQVSKGSDTVKIPANLAGKSEAEARQTLTDLGLVVADQTEDVDSEKIPQGDVVSTNPKLGATVKLGSTVTLQISKGRVEIPKDLVGKSEADARQALTDLKLTVGTSTSKDSPEPAGKVLSVSPNGGTSVAPGSTVTLTVSSGQVVMPNVLNMQEAEATNLLKGDEYKLNVQSVSVQRDGVAAGTVVGQSVTAGGKVTAGSIVSIEVVAQQETQAPPTDATEPSDGEPEAQDPDNND